MQNVTTDTIGKFINKHIAKHSDVVADDFPAYNKHTMLRVNYSKGEYVDGMVHTNSIKSYWAIVKRGQIGVYHW